LHTAQTALGRPHEVSRIELLLRDPQSAPALVRSLEARLGYDAESWQEANANFLSMFAMQNMMITFVIAALLSVGGFGILAVQLMLVLQRRREIAILRSMGFLRRDVISIFLLQGLTISSIGAVLGDLLGKLAVHYLAQVRMHIEGVVKSEHLLVVDSPRNYVYGLLFSLAVGLIAALLPAYQAARVEPVSVLRGAAA
jgi:lipoprotein-releasing system permease protein